MTDDSANARPSIVAAIIVNDGRVLMVRRRQREGSLSWQFPAGESEQGETPAATAVRETSEEVDLTVTGDRVLGERVHPATGRHMVYVACSVTSGTARLKDDDELDDVAWCDLDTMRGNVPTGVFEPVQQYLDQVLATA